MKRREADDKTPGAGLGEGAIQTPDTWTEKFESLERINSIREINESFTAGSQPVT